MTTLADQEKGNWNVEWLCEKWSEEAVDFARGRLSRQGIEFMPAGDLQAVYPKRSMRERVAGLLVPLPEPSPVFVPRLVPIREGLSSEVLRKIVGEPEECTEIKGNLLLNEGIQRMLDLAIAAVSNQTAANCWTNTTSYIGVGSSSTAEAASQTELQGAQANTSRFYKVMNATYPSRSNQTLSFQADFATGEANFAWNEWTISSGATTADGSGFLVGTINLNRKVSSLGTKASGTWTLTGQVTIS